MLRSGLQVAVSNANPINAAAAHETNEECFAFSPRSAYCTYRWHEASLRETSCRLGIHFETVYSLESRAREAIRQSSSAPRRLERAENEVSCVCVNVPFSKMDGNPFRFSFQRAPPPICTCPPLRARCTWGAVQCATSARYVKISLPDLFL